MQIDSLQSKPKKDAPVTEDVPPNKELLEQLFLVDLDRLTWKRAKKEKGQDARTFEAAEGVVVTEWKSGAILFSSPIASGTVTPVEDGRRIIASGANREDHWDLQLNDRTGTKIFNDSWGSRRTTWKNGVVKVENQDKSGYVRTPMANGQFMEHRWGQLPNQNGDLVRTVEQSGSTDEFATKVETAYMALPDRVRNFLIRSHVSIVAQGYDSGGGGFHNPTHNKITISEFPQSDEDGTKFNEQPVQTLGHEVGHAIDERFGLSQTTRFKEALAADLSAMRPRKLELEADSEELRTQAFAELTTENLRFKDKSLFETDRYAGALLPKTQKVVREMLMELFGADSVI